MNAMGLFVIGMIVGIVAANLVFVFMLGLCRSAGRVDDELDRIEAELRNQPKIVNKS